jgi:hypothetical protein
VGTAEGLAGAVSMARAGAALVGAQGRAPGEPARGQAEAEAVGPHPAAQAGELEAHRAHRPETQYHPRLSRVHHPLGPARWSVSSDMARSA